jgi:hypothetical protein
LRPDSEVGCGGGGQIGRRTTSGYFSAIHAKLAAVPAWLAGASEAIAGFPPRLRSAEPDRKPRYDWSDRYPAIAVTATKLRAKSFTLDCEAVVCGPDDVAIFDALYRRGIVSGAMLYAFDLLELDGEDLRGMPQGDRKKRLARLLGGPPARHRAPRPPTTTVLR